MATVVIMHARYYPLVLGSTRKDQSITNVEV